MQLEPVQTQGELPRRVIASYPTYEQAAASVERLAEDGFPVQELAIVGSDLRFVEQVTGRLDVATAALLGAATGAAVGFALALLSAAFVRGSAIAAVVAYWLVCGAVVGAATGLVVHARIRGQREFSSVSYMEASRYDLMSAEGVADEALSRLCQIYPTHSWPSNARQ